jgi:hypothetical protein
MKNIADLETRLLDELNQWFPKQCRDQFADFYLYYLPTTTEHDGGILIASDDPANPEYQLAMNEKIHKGNTVEQNFNWIRSGILRRLPVLSIS